MISFRYKSAIRQVKIKTKRELNDRMSSWLQGIFGIRNPIVGFKSIDNKYYDSETFYSNKDKFYGQIVDIIEANDQLEISFISDNLNSSSFIKPAHPQQVDKDILPDQYKPDSEEDCIKMVSDVQTLERKLQDNHNLTVYFQVHQIYKKEVSQSVSYLKNQGNNFKLNLFMKIYSGRSVSHPTYSIYIGKKLIVNLHLTREYKENIQMAIDRYSQRIQNSRKQKQNKKSDPRIFDKSDRFERGEERGDIFFKGSYQQENQAPSFTTYQLQERLNQDACQDYLLRMYEERILKKYQYLKLSQKCQQNFIEFYRIFCEGAIDNDYENFRNEILLKVENNLQILLSNVDEMDLSRPISRDEQRRQNLKKSVSNIEIVKVENYFEILDQLKPSLSAIAISETIKELLDQNQVIFALFSDYLSRKISKQQLAAALEASVEANSVKRPLSRCFARSSNRVPMNPSEDITGISPIQEQPAKSINFMNLGQIKSQQIKLQKNQPKQTPPMFGSSKNQGNFSPIKYMSDIDSNYKQAWSRLEGKAHLFEPQQFGLLYHYLQARDDSISNIIQQLEWDQQTSIQKLKSHLNQRIDAIMKQNFNSYERNVIQANRSAPEFDCLFENFKYQSDLSNFLSSLKSEIAHLEASPTEKVLTKKKSDSQLLGTKQKKKEKRRYSDEQSVGLDQSPKSSFSRPKTVEHNLSNLEIMNCFWEEQFESMTKYCRFSEKHKQDYIRNAYNEGNPAIFGWLYKFIRNKQKNIDAVEIKKDPRISESQHKILSRMIPIFNQFLNILAQEGRISDKIKQWHLNQFINYNITVISILQCFIQTGDEQQFVQNLTISYEYSNKQMQYYRLYLKRMQALLEEISAHDQISLEVFKMYPQQIKAMCQLYHITGNIDDLLDSLDLVHTIEANRQKLKVATLNFSGINMNPYEYHDGSNEIKQINQIMKGILSKPQVKEYFDNSKMSKIDKKLNNNTVSVRFGDKCFDADSKILTKEEYLKKWREQFESIGVPQVKQQAEQDKQKLAMFDYYCYISIIAYLYQIKFDDNYEFPNCKELDSTKVKQFLQLMLSRPSSQVDVKEQLVLEYLMKDNIDVFFIQEAGEIEWGQELIHNYHWVKNKDSVIIYKQDKIGKIKNNHELLKYAEDLNFNTDSVFIFSDRGYLLISSHLTSKDHKTEQAKKAFQVLSSIQKEHPLLKIIMGIDANHFLGEHKENFLHTIPKSEEETTSTKQRSNLQVQFKKSDVFTSAVKDHILSTKPIKDYSINVIDGNSADEGELLPNRRHPYDHFVVVANI